MTIDMQVRYYTEDVEWLCFRHAVKRVMDGEDVHTEVDDYYEDRCMISTVCNDCCMEEEEHEGNTILTRDSKFTITPRRPVRCRYCGALSDKGGP